MSWAEPRYRYGQRVRLLPLADPEGRLPAGRVIDLHHYGQQGGVEYEVRYFHEGKEQRIRMFEDELEDAEENGC